MNYCHVKENGNVVVCLILLLLTFEKSPSACDFTYSSVTSYFQINVNKMIKVLFSDYEVSVISNFEQDKHCIGFWPILDTYTILQTLREKAESDLKEFIDSVLRELSLLQNCSIPVSETCIKQKRPLVQVLRDLDYQQLKIISEVHSNCTQIRCVSGQSSNKTAFHEDNEKHTSQIYKIVLPIIFIIFFVIGALSVLHFKKNQRYTAGRTDDTEAEAGCC